ncbi:SEC-C metal-binding domain-containing protein [Candidatus Neptunochlamydia vexilliferae]|nr:SEC-C metal-binding domain-containing protein [Candidatus Neptunochlamydia vexilliferae]
MKQEVGRNDPCPCGSGKKFKKCCALKSPLQRRTFTAATPKSVENSVQRIAGMLSKEPPAEPPKKLDDKVKKQNGS